MRTQLNAKISKSERDSLPTSNLCLSLVRGILQYLSVWGLALCGAMFAHSQIVLQQYGKGVRIESFPVIQETKRSEDMHSIFPEYE